MGLSRVPDSTKTLLLAWLVRASCVYAKNEDRVARGCSDAVRQVEVLKYALWCYAACPGQLDAIGS